MAGLLLHNPLPVAALLSTDKVRFGTRKGDDALMNVMLL